MRHISEVSNSVHCVDCDGVREVGTHGQCNTCGSRSIMRRPVDTEAIRRVRRMLYEAAVNDLCTPADTRAVAAHELATGEV